MSVETSKKILKVFGIIGIVCGALLLIFGLMALAGASALDEDGKILAIVGGIILTVSAAISLIEGIFSVRAAKDSSKIMPAWIFAVIGLVSSVASLIYGAVQDITSVFSGVLSVAISALIFVAANTIKKNQ